MKRTLLIRPEAESDVEDAFKWYESKRTGLGPHFLLSVEEGPAGILRVIRGTQNRFFAPKSTGRRL